MNIKHPILSILFQILPALAGTLLQTIPALASPNSAVRADINLSDNKLTDKEKLLARELGFSEDALEAVKKGGGCELQKVALNSLATRKMSMQAQSNDADPWNDRTIQKLEQVKIDNPQLKDTVDSQLKTLQNRQKHSYRTDAELQERLQSLSFFLGPSRGIETNPLWKQVKQLVQAFITKDITRAAFLSELDKMIASERSKSTKKLINAVLFELPLENPTEIVELQNRLSPYGYAVYTTFKVQKHLRFESADEAENALSTIGNLIDIFKTPERKTIEELDSNNAKADAGPFLKFWIWPGAIVKAAGTNKWELTIPESYRGVETTKMALLVKSSEIDPFSFVEQIGSAGPNYRIENKAVIEKLKDWDKRYGVTLLGAEQDSVSIQLKTIPKDLSAFLTEVWKFCPDTIDITPDIIASASAMRSFAQKFRQDRSIVLWWD